MPFRINVMIVLLILFFALSAKGQSQDVQSRMKLGFEWMPHKKWELNAMYRLDLKENISTLRRSNFEAGIQYDINKWLSANIAYRFATSYSKDFHRFEAGMNAGWKMNKKWQLSFRSIVQRDFNYLNREYLQQEIPDWRWRNRISAKFSFHKKWSATVFTEMFSTAYPENLHLFRIRTGADISFKAFKKHQWAIGYFYQQPISDISALRIHTFELEYTFKLNTRKKKAKPTSNNSE